MITDKPIHIDFIAHSAQDYCTCGNYGETAKELWFTISHMDKPVYMLAILFHELWEKLRNDQMGLTDEEVTAFDLAHLDADDPGCLPDAPYHRQHMEAMKIERLMIRLAGENWNEYDKAVMALAWRDQSKGKS